VIFNSHHYSSYLNTDISVGLGVFGNHASKLLWIS